MLMRISRGAAGRSPPMQNRRVVCYQQL